MTWKVRHQGSPQSVEGLSLAQVVEGLQDGLWEPTDEVMGPGESEWVAIENHPQLAEVAAELEPPGPKVYDDETRLDMTALIDVCLVLLVFFILTTSYAALQRLIEAPAMARDDVTGLPVVTKDRVDNFMVKVRVRMQQDAPVIEVEGTPVEKDQLKTALSRFAGEKRKTELLIDYTPTVPYGTVIAIQDAAKGAGFTQVHILVPREELKKK